MSDEASTPAHVQVDRLARELADLATEDPDALARRVRALPLRDQADLALRLPARERLELLLHAPKPMRLVRALPDAEFYVTVREVGPHDALPLLAMGSAAQLQHLVDLEAWQHERFDAARAGAWVALLLEAGEPTALRFLRHADDEQLALLLQSWLRVEQIRHDEGDTPPVQGPESETGDERGLVSPDGYYRVRPLNPDHTAAVRQFLQLFFTAEPVRYQRAIWSAQWELPGETEERAFHWRQSRMEEHGFSSWDEALSVYAPPAGSARRPHMPAPDDPDAVPASRAALRVLGDRGPLLPAIAELGPEERERALFELTALANRLLIADRLATGSPDAHRDALRKAAGYVQIALARRADRSENEVDALRESAMLELFREGWSQVVELADRARTLAARIGGAPDETLELFDEPIAGRLAGLLEPRPRYLELASDPPGRELRDFRSTAELQETAAALEMAEVVAATFLDRLRLDLAALAGAVSRPARFSTLLLTTLAWHATRRELRCEVLPTEVAGDFLRTVASRRTAGPDAPARAMEALVRELGAAGGLGAREMSVIHAFGRACLRELADECGQLDPGVPPDPRFVSCLLLKREGS